MLFVQFIRCFTAGDTNMKTTENNNRRRTGIWIDGSKALIVNLKGGETEVVEIPSGIESRTRHIHEGQPAPFGGTRYGDKGAFSGMLRLDNRKKFAERRQQQINRYMDTVMERLKDSEEIAILGPAQMKKKLHARILETPHFNPWIAGMDATGKLSRNQLVKRVREIFAAEEADR